MTDKITDLCICKSTNKENACDDCRHFMIHPYDNEYCHDLCFPERIRCETLHLSEIAALRLQGVRKLTKKEFDMKCR
jgi:hypothetical protein